jgi:hypothetical protein
MNPVIADLIVSVSVPTVTVELPPSFNAVTYKPTKPELTSVIVFE